MAPITLALGEDACLKTIGENAARMLDVVAKSKSVKIDVAGAVNADLSILQLIEAARRHCSSIGCDLSLAGPLPPAMRALLDRSGFLSGTEAETSFWHHGDTPQ